MLFDVYGPNAGFQWLGLAMVLIALILLNEFARRTKAGGIFMLLRRSAASMTGYCLAVDDRCGRPVPTGPLNNPTHTVHEQLVPLRQGATPPPPAASAS